MNFKCEKCDWRGKQKIDLIHHTVFKHKAKYDVKFIYSLRTSNTLKKEQILRELGVSMS